ncbi:unnamed protein product [Kuraishia capsulata CBS 1993]|uniref:MICOS complex subunit MIC60 n=1 Tax=Kuraishia capsulata CBS 1993 TaxID=1382522 RepID=W6MWP6_9ASCO|nr:uncharacterized protein KUCA_T00003699001 [Kuraishia capsulata CBS 1993]CDK27720.1 unnamed protein product [Kuraishia capsulata CBS 1993]
MLRCSRTLVNGRLSARSAPLVRSSLLKRAQSTTTTVPPPIKKSHPIRKFFFRLTFVSVSLYAAGVFAATKSDPIQDAFIDYVPYGEEVLDFVEKWTNEPIPFTQVPSSDPLKGKLNVEKTIEIPKRGVASEKVDPLAEQPAGKPAKPAEAVKASTSEEIKNVLPDVILPLLSQNDVAAIDETFKSVVNSLNELLIQINTNPKSPNSERTAQQLHKNIQELSEKYAKLSASRATELDKLLESKLGDIKKSFESKEVELTKQYLGQLTDIKAEIEKKYQARLAAEIDSFQKTLDAQTANLITQLKVDGLKELKTHISSLVDSDQQGKLAKLEDLYAKVGKLEDLEVDLAAKVGEVVAAKDLKKSVSKINKLLNLEDPSPTIAKDLVKELTNLYGLTKPLDNTLILEAINSLPSNETLLKSGGVLTQAQLISRWELLVPELRSVSLLPPNAGVLGHISSFVFGKLLFSKSGSPVVSKDADFSGTDVESVIARVNYHLVRNELDDALEEVCSLKGWSRKLADDWIVATRQKLELKFLVELIDSELQVIA